jgi:hypothetical protein
LQQQTNRQTPRYISLASSTFSNKQNPQKNTNHPYLYNKAITRALKNTHLLFFFVNPTNKTQTVNSQQQKQVSKDTTTTTTTKSCNLSDSQLLMLLLLLLLLLLLQQY